MLEIKNLTVSYGAITALHGISLPCKDGDIVTLIGANGAGKTTTLKTISGLLKPKSGEILYDGQNIAESAAAPDREARHLARAGRPDDFCESDRAGKSADGRVFAEGQSTSSARELEYVFGMFPRLKEREKQIAGTLERRRAADARHRPRADEQAEIPDARRTVARHRAAAGENHFRKNRGDQPRSRASRFCWWNKTRISRWKFPITVTCWRRAGSFCRTTRPRCARIRR